MVKNNKKDWYIQKKTSFLHNPDGSKTFLLEVGDSSNTAIVLLHGIGADHAMWEPQQQLFAQQGYYVLIPDLLGHGKSSKVTTLELKDWENQINALLIQKVKQKNLRRCILVGVSMGGVIAQSFAMHYPHKVSQLILADTFAKLSSWREKLTGFIQLAGFRIYKHLGTKALAKSMSNVYKAPFAERAKVYFIRKSADVDFDQLILARKAINKIDALQKIDGREIATLVLVGDSFGEPFIVINRKIAKGIKGSKFVILKNAMDPSNLVNPEAFNRECLDFLRHKPKA